MADDQGNAGAASDPPAPSTPEKKSTKKGILIGVGIALVLGLAGGAFLVLSGDDEASAGEIFMEPADFIGEEPFSDEPLAPEPDPSLVAAPTDELPEAPSSTQVSTTAGGEPGLYGGTNDIDSCDAQQIVDFLAANPDKAAAWVAALNTDPNLRWDRGALTVQDIPDYIATLTPVTLMSDTRVTNHGFSDGRANPIQSVLARGTAVLVDQYGVPRTKCYCGNPLLPPQASSGQVRYTGNPWQGFNVNNVVVVVQNQTVINNFTLTNINGGRPIQRPAGSNVTGTGTTPPTTTAPPATTPPTTVAPVTTAPSTGSPPAQQCTPDAQTPESQLTIVNNSSQTIQVVWHSFDCSLVDQGTWDPGTSGGFNSFVGHIFSAVDAAGNEVASYTVPGPGAQTWTIG